MSNASEQPVPAAPLPRVRRTFGVHPNYLDIMCCMVLMFLLTSLLADTSNRAPEQNLPPVALPELPAPGAVSPAEKPAAYIVTVKPGPAYFAGEQAVTLESLAAALRQQRPAEVEIRGDQVSLYGHIMNAMRVCREAGITQVALTYQTKD